MSRSFDKRVVRIVADAGVVKEDVLDAVIEAAGKENRSVCSMLIKRNYLVVLDFINCLNIPCIGRRRIAVAFNAIFINPFINLGI